MKINSSAFKNYQFIPKKHTCDGKNINPPFQIGGVPEEAKSLVFIVAQAMEGHILDWAELVRLYRRE